MDGFWSVIVYDKDNYIPQNDRKVYSFNNITAKPDADGSITIQFGGCENASGNCIPILPDWSYTSQSSIVHAKRFSTAHGSSPRRSP